MDVTSICVYGVRSQPTYEELKPERHLPAQRLRLCSQPTYEELKPQGSATILSNSVFSAYL